MTIRITIGPNRRFEITLVPSPLRLMSDENDDDGLLDEDVMIRLQNELMNTGKPPGARTAQEKKFVQDLIEDAQMMCEVSKRTGAPSPTFDVPSSGF